jgi:hypothetical protein
VGNPVEGERDSGLKPNTISVVNSEQHSGLKVNADSSGKANSFCRLAEWRSAWSGMFPTGEPQGAAALDNYPALKLHE